MNVERIVAWFMSWVIWNQAFVYESFQNVARTFKKSFQDTVSFWNEFSQAVSGSAWLSIFILMLAGLVLVFEIVMLIVSVAVFIPFFAFCLTPLGMSSTLVLGYGLIKAIENDTFRRNLMFLHRVSWAFKETWKEERRKKRKEEKKKQFRVIEGGRKAS